MPIFSYSLIQTLGFPSFSHAFFSFFFLFPFPIFSIMPYDSICKETHYIFKAGDPPNYSLQPKLSFLNGSQIMSLLLKCCMALHFIQSKSQSPYNNPQNLPPHCVSDLLFHHFHSDSSPATLASFYTCQACPALGTFAFLFLECPLIIDWLIPKPPLSLCSNNLITLNFHCLFLSVLFT